MNISLFKPDLSDAVICLFTEVFSKSEGEEEGQSIGALVSNMINTTPQDELVGFVASEHDALLGCIFFSRFTLPSNKPCMILSPVAISSEHQKQGLGQQLIKFGIDYLRQHHVEVLLTYGDPAYYCRFGFKHITEGVIKAPVALSQPEGWLAQSLTHQPLEAEEGDTQCVSALRDPKYW